MDNNKLKIFAQETRLKLIKLVRAKLQLVLTTDTAELRGREKDVRKLRERVFREGEEAVVEEMAYTWFNRIMALRFMDANGYNLPMVVTPVEGSNRPEILADALSGTVDENLDIPQSDIDDLLQGRTGDNHPQETLYRRLLIAKCNELGNVMPFLFEKLKDYTELLLPDDLLSELSFVTDIRNGMSDEDCLEHIQIVGWLYQFYITDRKQEAEDAKSRKGGLHSDEQAAATQLFTPDWIVRYMVENTLGRIWLTLHSDSPLRQQMKYYIDPADNQPDPIPEHIKSVKDIRFIDPCMGSGHVLVYAFILFALMYEEEGYQRKDIPNLIFENNLYGLDIDRRCYQLASFALTMAACSYAGRRYLRRAEAPNVMALQPIDHDVIASIGEWAKDSLVWEFEHIDTIGSLLKISQEDCDAIKVEKGSVFSQPQQLMKTEAEYLSRKYDCVVTNPPYLGKGFSDPLKDYSSKEYPLSKGDTMVMYMEQAPYLSSASGFIAMINFQSWMFVFNYEGFREKIINNLKVVNLLHNGRGIFGADFGSVSFVMQNCLPNGLGKYYSLFTKMSLVRTNDEIRDIFLKHQGKEFIVNQEQFLNIPRNNFSYWVNNKSIKAFRKGEKLCKIGTTRKGMYTGLNWKYVRNWTEVNYKDFAFVSNSEESEKSSKKWYPYANGGNFRKWYGDYEDVVFWQHNGALLRTERNEQGKIRAGCFNLDYIFKKGIVWSSITISERSMRIMCDGSLFSSASNAWFGEDPRYVLAFLNSKAARLILKAINPTVNANPGDLGQMPLVKVENRTNKIELLSKINICVSKLDWDSHETSWDFVESPLVAILKSASTNEKASNGQIVSKQRLNGSQKIPNQAAKDTQLEAKTVSFATQKVPNYDASDNQQVTEKNLEKSCKDISYCEEAGQPLHDYNTSIIRLGERLNAEDEKSTSNVGSLELAVEAFKGLWGARFLQLHHNEEELNRQFIDIYGLQDELTPDAPLKEITILQNGEISVDGNNIIWHNDVLMKQLVSYLIGCAMGRYAIEKPGLIIANQGETIDDFHKQVSEPKVDVDDDGIIPVLDGDYFPDDATERIKKSLRNVFGESNYTRNLSYMEQALGKDIRSYLTKDFYKDHCKMYQKRPIYWMFASKKGTFQALVYMHRITPDTLSRLLANYVQPFIAMIESDKRQQDELHAREDITTKEKNRAQKLSDAYNKQLIELHNYEQQLMELASHRIDIDLDDGVKVNYAKYGDLVAKIK